jgi:hypothetical protein
MCVQSVQALEEGLSVEKLGQHNPLRSKRSTIILEHLSWQFLKVLLAIIDLVDCMFEDLQVFSAYLGSISALCLNGSVLKVFPGCLFIFIALKNPQTPSFFADHELNPQAVHSILTTLLFAWQYFPWPDL